MHKLVLSYCTVVVLSLFFSGEAQAITLSMGGTLARHELMIYKKEDTSSQVAKFRSNFHISPAVHIDSSEKYFSDSRWGWLLEFNIGGIDLSRQVVGGTEKDIQTGINGYFGHFNPIIFYRLGDKRRKGMNHWRFTAGLGYGFSFLYLDGDFEKTSVAEEEKGTVVIDQARGLFLLPAVVLDYSLYNWFAKMSVCFAGSGFEVDDYNYQLLFRSVSVGYSFEL